MEIVQDKFADGLRYLHQSQYSGEGSRGCQDEQDRCKSTDCFYKDRPDITELNALVYEQTDDQGIHAGQRMVSQVRSMHIRMFQVIVRVLVLVR